MSLHVLIEARDQPIDHGFGGVDFDAPDISTRFVQLVLEGPQQYGEEAIILQIERQHGLRLAPLMRYFHAADSELDHTPTDDAWQTIDAIEDAAVSLATSLQEGNPLTDDCRFSDPESEMQVHLFADYFQNNLFLQDLMLLIEELAQQRLAGCEEVRLVLHD
ncbi:MAG: hypothetical protein ACOCZ8_02925 [Bacteroidota bacterium]